MAGRVWKAFEKDIAYIRFSIEDTGIGIAPEAIEKDFFDSFEQGSAKTAQEYGGTGFGTNDFPVIWYS